MKELVLGGARSGKSSLAERYAAESGLEVVYIATATAGDAEMSARIALHRERRPAGWGLAEEPRHLAAVLEGAAAMGRCLLVDCLTLWLNNVIADEALYQRERAALLDALPGLPGRVILVSNEVGMGIVPMGELTRRYCDEAGRLHQDLAQMCDRVTFVAAGLPLVLKGKS
jgi:adenosylcobinamide kinase/adenosylcobinamide-phosphate guanylyltransferase